MPSQQPSLYPLSAAPARVCAHPDCSNEFGIPGIGTTPYISGPFGGIYFCSRDCRDTYPQEVSLEDRLTAAFAEAKMPSPAESARNFIDKFGPSIDDSIPATIDKKGLTHHFRIQTAERASLIACVLCGDTSFAIHTGTDGVVQTLPRIGHFATVISRVHPNALLREIRQVKFNRKVPLGKAIIVSARQSAVRGLRVEWVVSAILESTSEAICRETTVVTVGDLTD
jgi:hypothetical protein